MRTSRPHQRPCPLAHTFHASLCRCCRTFTVWTVLYRTIQYTVFSLPPALLAIDESEMWRYRIFLRCLLLRSEASSLFLVGKTIGCERTTEGLRLKPNWEFSACRCKSAVTTTKIETIVSK